MGELPKMRQRAGKSTIWKGRVEEKGKRGIKKGNRNHSLPLSNFKKKKNK